MPPVDASSTGYIDGAAAWGMLLMRSQEDFFAVSTSSMRFPVSVLL